MLGDLLLKESVKLAHVLTSSVHMLKILHTEVNWMSQGELMPSTKEVYHRLL